MRPPRWKRALTPGRAIAALVGLVGLYYAWGAVFTPGGTGSNVVLGLLVAGAALYLVTVNLGPAIDDAVFAGGDRERRAALRAAEELDDELGRVLAKPKKARLPAAAVEPLAAARAKLAAARDAAYADRAATAALKDAHAAVEDALAKAIPDDGKGGLFAQARSLGFAFAVALGLRAFAVEPFQIPSGSMIPTLLVGDHLFVARAMYGLQVPMAKTPKYFLRWSLPQPGDVVVFVAPDQVGMNAGEDWIKRVIAGPGQRVKMVDGVLHVDGAPYARKTEPVPTPYLDYDERSGTWDEQTGQRVVEDVAGRTHETMIPEGDGEWPNAIDPWRTSQGRIRRGDALVDVGPARGLTCTEEECVVDDGHIFVMGDNRDHSSDGRKWGAVPVDNVKGRALFIWMSVDGSERSIDLGRFTLPRFRWERLFDGIR